MSHSVLYTGAQHRHQFYPLDVAIADLIKLSIDIGVQLKYSNTPLYRPTPYTINVGGIDDLAV